MSENRGMKYKGIFAPAEHFSTVLPDRKKGRKTEAERN